MIKTIATSWDEITAHIRPGLPKSQLIEMKDLFYFGFGAAMDTVTALSELPDDATAGRELFALQEEMNRFMDKRMVEKLFEDRVSVEGDDHDQGRTG